LRLMFYGDVNNTHGSSLYISLVDSNDLSGMVTYVFPEEDWLSDGQWHELNIDLDDFTYSGLDLRYVDEIIIGIENGSGTVYFDGIRLYQPRCLVELQGDFDDNCKVDIEDLDIMADEWLSIATFSKTDIYDDGITNMKDLAILGYMWLEDTTFP